MDEPPPHHAPTWTPIPRLTLEQPSSLLSPSVTVTPLMISLEETGRREWGLGWLGKREDTGHVG